VLDARSGAMVRTVAVGALPVDVALDEAGGRVWVVNQESNTVSVLDARSGTVLSTVAVGLAPSAIAVDGRNGFAFVLNGGGTSPGTAAWNWVPGWLRRWLRVDTGPRAIPGSVSMLGEAR
jgi:YVTN family beta-propeller protein